MTDTTPQTGTERIEHDWIAVLAEYWRQADWEQFSGQQKSRADTFGERVNVAARAGDVHGALDKLAKGLGLATPELPTNHLDALKASDDAVRVLRREHVWLVNKADETVSNYFAAINGDDTNPATSDLSDFISTDAEADQ